MPSCGLYRRSQFTWGVTACLLAQLCWSVTPVLQRYFVRLLDAYTQNGIRCTAAAISLLPVLLWAIHRGKISRMIWLDALPSALLASLGQTTWTLALYRIDSGFCYFICELQVIWAAVLAMSFFRDERLLATSPKFWIASLLAGVGIAALVVGAKRPDALHPAQARLIWEGVALAAACSVIAGLQTVYMRWRLTRHPAAAGYAVVSIYLAIILDVVMLRQGTVRPAMDLGPWMLLLMGASGMVGLAWANSFWIMGLKRIGVTISYGIALLAPFGTSLVSTVALGEPLTGFQWLGGTVVMAGIALLLMARRERLPGAGAIAAAAGPAPPSRDGMRRFRE